MKKVKFKMMDLSAREILTKDQLQKIMGGDGSVGSNSGSGCTCSVNSSCTLFDGSQTYQGECDANFGGGSGGVMGCGCSTSYGPYQPTSGQSHCCS